MDHRPRSLLLVPLLLLTALVAFQDPATAAGAFDREARLEASGDYDGALREYAAFLARSPNDRLAPVAALASANIEIRVRRDSIAGATWCERILRDYPGTPWASMATRQKGAIFEARQDWRAAAETYEIAASAAQAVPDSDHVLPESWAGDLTIAVADCYYKAGDPARVIQTYRKILDADSPAALAATALYRLGDTYERQGESKEAADAYRRLIVEYPSSPSFSAAMRKRDLIDRYAQIDWKPYVAYAAGTDSVNARRLAGALATCGEVLASTDNAALIECVKYRQITLDTALSGDYIEGCRRLRDFLEEYPSGLRTEMARTTLEGSWTPVAEMESAARAHPDDVEAMRNLGEMYLGMRSPKAVETLARAVAADSNNAEGQLYLGYAYARAARSDEAIRPFGRYLEMNPKDTDALNMIGYTYIGLGQPEKAVSYFERYAALAPDDPNAHDSLGEGLMRSGRIEEAAMEYEKAVGLNHSFSNSYYMLGGIYRRLGRTDKALGAYRRFLDLAPNGPEADEARSACDSLSATGTGEGSKTKEVKDAR